VIREMDKSYSDDFKVTTKKKGGGGRKQNTERKKQKNKNSVPTCYSSKHVRAKEAILAKKIV
jgi:hypothetical protein